MKINIPKEAALRLINHGPAILVSCYEKEKPNIITLAWNMPVSGDPPLLAISVSPKRYSHNLIKDAKEFVVNVPSLEILKKVHFCGTTSGRKINKFKEANLTPIPAQKLKAPLIKECIGHIECILKNSIEAGDHTIFVGEIVAASVEEGFFDGYWILEKAKTIHHLGGEHYTIPEEEYNP